MMRRRAVATHPSAVGTCPNCGKVQYPTRRAARKAARELHPGEPGLRAYPCGAYWHFGHMPAAQRHGAYPLADEPTVDDQFVEGVAA